MAIPVISPTQSVLGYKQWEYFEFQPYATHSPTRWRLNNPLHAGLALDVPPLYAVTGNASTDVLTATGHPFLLGDQVVIASKTGGSGLAVDTIYYARDVIAGVSLKLAATLAGAALALGSNITEGVISKKQTGLITGAAQVPGVRSFGVIASNADGDSAEQQFTIGVEPGALVPDALPWIAVDTVSGQIRVDNVAIAPLTPEILKKMEEDEKFEPPVVLAVKEGDDLLSRISFVRGQTVQDITLTTLRLVLKEFEPEQTLVVSGAFQKQGNSTGTNFLLHSKFDGAALAGALSNYEGDKGTFFYALAEFERGETNNTGVGPATLIRSSATFVIRIERDIADNA